MRGGRIQPRGAIPFSGPEKPAPADMDLRDEMQKIALEWPGAMEAGVDQLRVADITYIRLEEEFVYLAVILDVYSRRVIGWHMNDGLTRPRRACMHFCKRCEVAEADLLIVWAG